MENSSPKPLDQLDALGDPGTEFDIGAEWKWLEEIPLGPSINAFDGSVIIPDVAPQQSASTSNRNTSSANTELNVESEYITPSDTGPEFRQQVGVFDSPLDLSGIWPPTEPLHGHSSLSNGSRSQMTSPRVSASTSRYRSETEKGSPGLPRRRSRYSTNRLAQRTPAVLIPPSPKANDSFDPMQRWQDSPPEDEPASISAILDALNSSEGSGAMNHSATPEQSREAFQGYRNAASSTSGESGASKLSRGSVQSENSGSGSSRNSSTLPSRKSRGVTKPRQNKKGKQERRIFCCTFCCDRFKTKYDWTRHEKSLHLNLEAWICAPFGGTVFSMTTRRSHCAYCHSLEPNAEHLELHNHRGCHGDSTEPRVFRRKDHLVQHLRLVHDLEVMPLIDEWKIDTPAFTSRCGICDQTMNSWDERNDHIAAHYKKGSSISDWHGEHEFPPSIAAQVTHALPPYLIGSESTSMVPFSATDSNVRDHFFQISLNAGMTDDAIEPQPLQSLPENFTSQSEVNSFAQILTMHLSRYAQDQMKQGIVPTDDMFQRVARRLIYDSEDSWNQTVADNSQWLSAFRRLHYRPEPGDHPAEGSLRVNHQPENLHPE